MNSILISLLAVPLLGALFVFSLPTNRKELFRPISILVTLISLTQSIYILTKDSSKSEFIITSKYSWIQTYGLDLSIGLSGMSALLIFLSSLLVFVSLLSINKEHGDSKGFIGSISIAHGDSCCSSSNSNFWINIQSYSWSGNYLTI